MYSQNIKNSQKQPTEAVFSKKKLLTTMGLIILGAVAAAFYLFWGDFFGKEEGPPVITFSTESKYQGMASDDEIICKIPNLYEISQEKVANYQPQAFTSTEQYNLQAGIHLYHYGQDLTVQQILDYIQPVAGNKLLIAHYNPGPVNSAKKFSVYPQLEGQTTVPGSYIIPANEGFIIMSCKESKIWKIKSENIASEINSLTIGANLINLANQLSSDTWILISILDKDGLQYIANTLQNKIKSIHVQNAEGFSFEKANLSQVQLKNNYYMVWIKLGAPALACTQEGQSLGAVFPDNNSYCCPGLKVQLPDNLVDSKGICVKEADTGELCNNTCPITCTQENQQFICPALSQDLEIQQVSTDLDPTKNIRVSWKNPENMELSLIKEYQVKYGEGIFLEKYGSESKTDTLAPNTDGKNIYDLKDLDWGKMYWIQIITKYKNAYESLPSIKNNLKLFTPFNETPKISDETSTTAKIEWTAPASTGAQTGLYYKVVAIENPGNLCHNSQNEKKEFISTSSTSTSLIMTGLKAGTRYKAFITVLNSGESVFGNCVEFETTNNSNNDQPVGDNSNKTSNIFNYGNNNPIVPTKFENFLNNNSNSEEAAPPMIEPTTCQNKNSYYFIGYTPSSNPNFTLKLKYKLTTGIAGQYTTKTKDFNDIGNKFLLLSNNQFSVFEVSDGIQIYNLPPNTSSVGIVATNHSGKESDVKYCDIYN